MQIAGRDRLGIDHRVAGIVLGRIEREQRRQVEGVAQLGVDRLGAHVADHAIGVARGLVDEFGPPGEGVVAGEAAERSVGPDERRVGRPRRT